MSNYENDSPIFEAIIYFIIFLSTITWIYIEATGVFEK